MEDFAAIADIMAIETPVHAVVVFRRIGIGQAVQMQLCESGLIEPPAGVADGHSPFRHGVNLEFRLGAGLHSPPLGNGQISSPVVAVADAILEISPLVVGVPGDDGQIKDGHIADFVNCMFVYGLCNYQKDVLQYALEV